MGETSGSQKTNKGQTQSRSNSTRKKAAAKTTKAAQEKTTRTTQAKGAKPAGSTGEQKKNGQSRTHRPDDFTNMAAVEPFVVKDPEAMARNMAHMVEELGRAASAWVKPREAGEKTDAIAGPGTDMVKTFSKLSEYWLSDPKRAVEAQTHLLTSYFDIWSNSIRKLSGEEATDAAANHLGDRRFSDEDWQNNAFFSFLRQAYWVTADWADKLVKDADGLDPHTRHKAEFYIKQITSALSPTNFVLTNPKSTRKPSPKAARTWPAACACWLRISRPEKVTCACVRRTIPNSPSVKTWP